MTGADLRAFRERHGLTQRACAALLNVTWSAVIMAEKRNRSLSGPTARLIEVAECVPGAMQWMQDASERKESRA